MANFSYDGNYVNEARTIRALYEWACANGCEDARLEIFASTDCGFSGGGGKVTNISYYDDSNCVCLENDEG